MPLELADKEMDVCARRCIALMVTCAALSGSVALRISHAATLEVGPGKRFQQIEVASAQAREGDVILVYPLADDQPYQKTIARRLIRACELDRLSQVNSDARARHASLPGGVSQNSVQAQAKTRRIAGRGENGHETVPPCA